MGGYPSWWPSDTPRPWRIGRRHNATVLGTAAVPVLAGLVVLASGVGRAANGEAGLGVALVVAGVAAVGALLLYLAHELGWDEVTPQYVWRRRLIGSTRVPVSDVVSIKAFHELHRQRATHFIELRLASGSFSFPPNTQAEQGRTDERRLRACFEPVIEARAAWMRWAESVPAEAFGDGAGEGFDRFVEFDSIVPMTSLSQAEEWLRGCTFEEDADGWMHPADFEAWRHGNVVDHSLWAWRRLVQAGFETELVVGQRFGVPHVWVMVKVDGERRIFETLMAESSMLVDAFTGPVEYRPSIGIDHELHTYRYGS